MHGGGAEGVDGSGSVECSGGEVRAVGEVQDGGLGGLLGGCEVVCGGEKVWR